MRVSPHFVALLTAIALLGACGAENTDNTDNSDAAPSPKVPLVVVDLAGSVDPFIGSAGSGNVIPGALVPHGMVRASPDTVDALGAIGTYHWESDKLQGFSHTHLEGPGGSNNGYGHLLVMPFATTITDALPAHAEPYSHDDEEAEPGYYAVTLGNSKTRVELTATAHAAVHRYTFAATKSGSRAEKQGHLLIDLALSNGRSDDGLIERVGKRTVRGWGGYSVHPPLGVLLSEEPTGDARVYFHVEFDRDLTASGTFKFGKAHSHGAEKIEGAGSGMWVDFDAGSAPVEVKVGVSFISMAQAKVNLEAEVGALAEPRFDTVRANARKTWNAALSRVKVEGGDAALRTTFYTALYHSLFQPADYTEVGGVFHSASDGAHHTHDARSRGLGVAADPKARPRRFFTDDWCMWDSYRTLHPLGTLVEPELRADIAWSMLHMYSEGGWLPKCTWNATGYSRVMTGNPAVVILADAFVKDQYGGSWHDVDIDLAWKAITKALEQDNKNPGEQAFCGYLNLGTVPAYRKLGWVPGACDKTQSASMTLEYANADWAAARFAEANKDTVGQQRYDARGGNWKHHFNSKVGFMQAKDANGDWITPFDPTEYAVHFVEATSWIFTFFVPHDPAGLAAALGGEAALDAKLDGFFKAGEFDISNQPSFHIPWLYGRAGRPDKAQDKVRETLMARFGATPKGLPGNDDAGSTSAWFVLGAMGLFPLSPGDGVWELGAPLFERVTVWMPTDGEAAVGRELVIEAPGSGTKGHHVATAALRGKTLGHLRVDHSELAKGGILTLSAE
ncbi:MAG: GH92 family glycosyl hydrolase [Myxococcales bacterium]|nr:GH92 family glycosyl hydrolase [Myxococcales bacterium]